MPFALELTDNYVRIPVPGGTGSSDPPLWNPHQTSVRGSGSKTPNRWHPRLRRLVGILRQNRACSVMTFQEMKRSNVEIHVRELNKTSDWILQSWTWQLWSQEVPPPLCLFGAYHHQPPPPRFSRPSHACVFLIQPLFSLRNPSGTTKICLNWLLIHFVYS